jgi:hypothetical protein
LADSHRTSGTGTAERRDDQADGCPVTISETVVPGGQDSDPALPSRRARLLRAALPPLLAFILANMVDYVAAAHSGLAAGFFTPERWIHWDSHLYLAIADKGYKLRHCHKSTVPPHSFCGNAGWLPLYPGLISLSGKLGVPLTWAGKYLADVFALGTLVLAWLLIGPSWSARRLLALALAAVFPGQVYYFAVFPVSLVAFLSLAFLLWLVRRRYVLAGLAGAAAAWAYPTGFVLPAVAVMYTAIADRGRSFADWLGRVLPSAGIPALGIAALLLAYQAWTRAWNAYFLVQAKYGNGFHSPAANFLASLTGTAPPRYPIQQLNEGYKYLPPKAQTVLVAVLVLTLVTASLTVWRSSLTRTDWAVLCYTVLVWLFPMTQSVAVSRYRSEALLIPCVALVRRLPVVIQIPLVVAAAWIAFGMAPLFLHGKLI